jgi:hypothetical protein
MDNDAQRSGGRPPKARQKSVGWAPQADAAYSATPTRLSLAMMLETGMCWAWRKAGKVSVLARGLSARMMCYVSDVPALPPTITSSDRLHGCPETLVGSSQPFACPRDGPSASSSISRASTSVPLSELHSSCKIAGLCCVSGNSKRRASNVHEYGPPVAALLNSRQLSHSALNVTGPHHAPTRRMRDPCRTVAVATLHRFSPMR